MPKLLIEPKLIKTDAHKIFKEFYAAKTTKDKQRIWDKLVPYANKYPDLYREYQHKHTYKREEPYVPTLKKKGNK